MVPGIDYKEEVNRRIGQAVRQNLEEEAELDDAGLSMEAFRALIGEPTKEEKNRKIHVSGLAAVAAVLICVIAVVQFVAPVREIFAGPTQEQDIYEENGGIVIGGSQEGNVERGVTKYISYDDVPEELKNQLLWFEAFPTDYELVSIEVEISDNGNKTLLSWKNKSDVWLYVEEQNIRQTQEGLAVLNKYENISTIKDVSLYYRKWEETCYYAFSKGNLFVVISTDQSVPIKEIEAMVASIKMD